MAVFDTFRTVVDGPSIANRFFSAFTGFAGGLASWNDVRVTRNALSKLSDHELDDLGLSRADIAEIGGKLRKY